MHTLVDLILKEAIRYLPTLVITATFIAYSICDSMKWIDMKAHIHSMNRFGSHSTSYRRPSTTQQFCGVPNDKNVQMLRYDICN